jgi:hypothetical protein
MDEKDREVLALIAARVEEMHATLQRFRPLLDLFAPNGHGSDLQRAGVLRTMRRAARQKETP